MREIEFRAWLKNEKRMTKVQELYFNGTGVIGFKESNENSDYDGVCHFKDFELMQYVGLKDKNGTKIFKGDIVEYWYRSLSGTVSSTAIVKFYDGAFQLEDIDDSDSTELLYLAEDVEVIGNIYDNPELLEV